LQRRSATLVALLLFLGGSFAIYGAALSFDFLNFDDTFYVRDNPRLNGGFSWGAVRWALEANLFSGDRAAEYWMPVTLLSRLLDAQLFGTHGGFYHAQNILFHGLNAWLIFLVLANLTGAMARSLLVAALFLVHPINAEVVCWIALRKDVLAGSASLLTIWLYIRYAKQQSLLSYAMTLGAFALAILCKPSVVALPLALLLLDWWPLNRVNLDFVGNIDGKSLRPVAIVLLEKLPFLILALVATLVTFVGQRDLGLVAVAETRNLPVDLGRTALGYADYIRRIFQFDSLCALYPTRPWSTIPSWELWKAAVILVGVTCATMWLAVRKYRPALMGWLWFIGLLLPVSGLFQFGRQATADRYMYLPIIGILIFVVWLVADALEHQTDLKRSGPSVWRHAVVGLFSLFVLLLLSHASREQCQTWRDDLALWRQAMAAEPDNAVAFNNFGSGLTLAGAYKVAETYRRASLKIAPDSIEQIGNLGRAMAQYGNAAAAVPLLERAVQAEAENMEFHRWLIVALRRSGQLEKANLANGRYEQFRGRVFLSLALDYLKRGETEQARAQFSLASAAQVRAGKYTGTDLELWPASKWLPSARDWLVRIPSAGLPAYDRLVLQGYVAFLAGEPKSAARWFGLASDLRPGVAEPRWRRALCLAQLGQSDAANAESIAARACQEPFKDGESDWDFVSGKVHLEDKDKNY
jgi:protein O-mannosyl-transferase